jgi:hypothetical protein
VAYGAMVEPYAVDGSFTVVDVRFEESPDVPFALSPDLSDVSGIQIERDDDESFPFRTPSRGNLESSPCECSCPPRRQRGRE